MYNQDYDERLCPDRIAYTGGVWYLMIQPYIKNTGVLKCPDMDPTLTAAEKAANYPPCTYGMNYRLTQGNPANLDDAPSLWYSTYGLGQLRTPADTIWVCDNAYVTNPTAQPVHQDDPTKWRFDPSNWNREGYTRFPQDPHGSGIDYLGCCWNGDPWRPAPVHQGGTNSVFCDGHVKFYKTEKMVNPARGAADCIYDNTWPAS